MGSLPAAKRTEAAQGKTAGGMADAKAQPKRRKPAQVSLYGSAPPARLPAKEYGYANVDASPGNDVP